eukprot:TRINITY_DN59078_c0_g1_i1.p1 TRINITY_DN59078_c0_g1~~TRINITY_DN59078_c0_g1_i1.p1  ORF type:complete len:512 (-),score=67.12 TRINITY_DN59078_c0_g1_i1:268-1803(-)
MGCNASADATHATCAAAAASKHRASVSGEDGKTATLNSLVPSGVVRMPSDASTEATESLSLDDMPIAEEPLTPSPLIVHSAQGTKEAVTEPSSPSRFHIQMLSAGCGWQDVPAADNRFILQSLGRGSLRFQMVSGNTDYELDFNDMDNPTRTNRLTSEVCRLRLTIPLGEQIVLSEPLVVQGTPLRQQAAVPQIRSPVSTGSAPGASPRSSAAPQSARGNPSFHPLDVLTRVPHAPVCFSNFVKNEERLCDNYAVCYHSYSHAALLYEVQAAIASVLFGFDAKYATLPKLLIDDFKSFPDVSALLGTFNAEMLADKKDQDPRFSAVAIPAMCSLVATGPECCVPAAFSEDYSCKDMSYRVRLEDLLQSCYISKDEAGPLANKIVALAEQRGLDVSSYGGAACRSGKPGHLLQIFIKRTLLDKLAYASLPYGSVDGERMPLSEYMAGDNDFSQGQVRILAHPKHFLDMTDARLFVTSADGDFLCSRQVFQAELSRLLSIFLAGPLINREHLA